MNWQTQTPTASRLPLIIIYRGRAEGPESQALAQMLQAMEENSVIQREQRHPLTSTWNHLNELHNLPENWNGNNVSAPNPGAIRYAKNWIQDLYHDAQDEELLWLRPHVTANEEGEVAFEWSRGHKRLTVYVAPEEAWYINSWGPSITSEMADGNVNTRADRMRLWSWLVG